MVDRKFRRVRFAEDRVNRETVVVANALWLGGGAEIEFSVRLKLIHLLHCKGLGNIKKYRKIELNSYC